MTSLSARKGQTPDKMRLVFSNAAFSAGGSLGGAAARHLREERAEVLSVWVDRESGKTRCTWLAS